MRLICVPILLAACASSQLATPPVEIRSTGQPGDAAATFRHKLTATVLQLDTAHRKLTLQNPDGEIEHIMVPPDTPGFENVVAGDRIDLEVNEGILFEYQPVGSTIVVPTSEFTPPHDADSALQAAAAGTTFRSTVTVTGVDIGKRIVRFQDLDGNRYEAIAGQDIPIEKISRGDRLLATYKASLAITIDKK